MITFGSTLIRHGLVQVYNCSGAWNIFQIPALHEENTFSLWIEVNCREFCRNNFSISSRSDFWSYSFEFIMNKILTYNCIKDNGIFKEYCRDIIPGTILYKYGPESRLVYGQNNTFQHRNDDDPKLWRHIRIWRIYIGLSVFTTSFVAWSLVAQYGE